jgi:hypothetical protein
LHAWVEHLPVTQRIFLLPLSRLLYPGKNGGLGDFFGDPGNALPDCNPSGSKDGKYELLTVANEVIAEEIKDLMTKSKSLAIVTAVSMWWELVYVFKVQDSYEFFKNFIHVCLVF